MGDFSKNFLLVTKITNFSSLILSFSTEFLVLPASGFCYDKLFHRGFMFIVCAKRTPIGRFQGGLSDQPATRLGAVLIREILRETLLPPVKIEECIAGQVLTAGAGQAPARQTALQGGLKPSTRCVTINKVCGSGLKAVMTGCDAIQLKQAQLVIAGGQENMTLAPHILQKKPPGASFRRWCFKGQCSVRWSYQPL